MATRTICVAAGAAWVGVMCAEFLVRLISPQAIGMAPPMYIADEVLMHRLSPGYSGDLRSGEYSTHLAINSRGFRGAPWNLNAARRVLVLGDSFTFGYGVEEHQAFPSLMRDALGDSVAVFNAAVPGYGTLQEGALAERLIPEVRPHVVALGFTVGSDVQDNLQMLRSSGGYEVRDGFLVQKGTPQGAPLPFKAWLQRRSHLYVLLQRARVRASIRRMQQPTRHAPCEHFLAREPCGNIARAWQATLDAISDIDLQCRRNGARLIVVAIPHPVQVDHGMWQREIRRLPTGDQDLDRYAPQRKLSSVCTAIGAGFIDPLPVMRGHPVRSLYFRLDRHLTPTGHARVGAAVIPVVRAALQSLDASVDTPGLESQH